MSVRLAAFGHMLCFLNCHLPAHMDKAEQRKDTFQTILSLQQFPGPGAQGILDHEYGGWGRRGRGDPQWAGRSWILSWAAWRGRRGGWRWATTRLGTRMPG